MRLLCVVMGLIVSECKGVSPSVSLIAGVWTV